MLQRFNRIDSRPRCQQHNTSRDGQATELGGKLILRREFAPTDHERWLKALTDMNCQIKQLIGLRGLL
jgi:hypothetical protein